MKQKTTTVMWGSAIGAAVASLMLLSTPALAAEESMVFYGVQMEQLEHRAGDQSEDMTVWGGGAFIGTDELKVRWIGEGEYDNDADQFEKLENQLVGQVPVSDFFDVKAGVRVDTPEGADRWYGVLGLSGLAPQWIHVDANLFVSEEGDASARFEAEYELLITNRLIVTPSLELDMAFSDDTEIGIGSGVSSSEIGLRLSYDLVDRMISPYIGIVHEQKLGNTKDLARDEGEDTSSWFGVIGTKLVF